MKNRTRLSWQDAVLEPRIVPSNTVPELLRNVNDHPETQGSWPREFLQVNNSVYFLANTPETGEELWKTDGTSSGTILVCDINPGPIGSSISNLTNYNGLLYFTANDGIHGSELWRSDGTSDGTKLVHDFRLGSASSSTDALTVYNGFLYFGASVGSGMSNTGLWRSDGTSDGTTLVRNIRIENRFMVEFKGLLYFFANDGVNGIELWRSNGTAVGTSIVRDIHYGPASSLTSFGGSPLTVVGDELFFIANDGVSGAELWATNGSHAGTRMVRDIIPGPEQPQNLREFTNYKGTLYFTVNDGLSGTNGYQIWQSDGTSNGTVRITDKLHSGLLRSNNTTIVNDVLFFSGEDGIHGNELWRTDGTSSGTFMVRDIRPGAASSYNPFGMVNWQGLLYFSANDGTHGTELWQSDGTSSGTFMLADINPVSPTSGVTRLMPTSIGLFFAASNGLTGMEPWITDGTSTGTRLIRDINTSDNGSYITRSENVNGVLYFSAGHGKYGSEIWKSDGTSTGTILVADTVPGHYGSNARYLTNMNGTLYYSGSDINHQRDLWRSDGTPDTTVQLTFGNVDPRDLFNANGKLYFIGHNPDHGFELWTSDGTLQGTNMVIDINAGPSGSISPNSLSYPPAFAAINDIVYFFANDGIHGSELWRTDGTPSGTYMVRDINPGSAGSLPASNRRLFADFDDKVYFVANDGTHGFELWSSDGTSAGTSMVLDITPGIQSTTIRALSSNNGTLYFTVSSGSYRGLYASDGSSTGTILLNMLAGGTAILSAGDQIYVTGSGNWVSDGTVYGTKQLSFGFVRGRAVVAGGSLFYVATQAGQYDLWRSDGTVLGTHIIDSSALNISDHITIGAAEDRLYFRANGEGIGAELFILRERPSMVSFTSDSANGSYFTGQSINVTVRFNRPLTLTGGALRLTMDSGGVVLLDPFSDVTATGTYLINAGESSPQLKVVSATLDQGATLTDLNGNPAILDLPPTNLNITSFFIVNPLPPTTTTGVIVNLGATQRSRLTSITLNFAQPVDAAALSVPGGVSLTRTSGGTPVVVQTGAVGANGLITLLPATGMVPSVTLIFSNANGAATTDSVQHGSLTDGRWQLNIPWLSYTSPLGGPNLRRLFGDSDNNGTVDAADFAAFGAVFGGAGPAFDFDNNGIVDGIDFAQFGTRYGRTL